MPSALACQTTKRYVNTRFGPISAGPFWPLASRTAANTMGRGRMDAAYSWSFSHCRYENGETKSKYQSAIMRSRLVRAARGNCGPHDPARGVVERAPCGDLVEGPCAADAEARHRIDPADADARRSDAGAVGGRHLRQSRHRFIGRRWPSWG